MLRSTALFIAAALAGCVAPDADDSSGQIDLALVGQAENGSTYRLRDASITVTGPAGTLTFATEDDPDHTAITQRLAAGTYALELGGSWRLERLDAGTATPVTATLLSTNPQGFAIDADALTRVALRFGVPGGVVQLGAGDLEIGVDVDVIPERMSVVLEPTGFQVDEGQNLVLGVRLSHRPAAATTVTVVSSDPAALFVSPDTLTFTPDDWSVAKYTSLQAPLDADSQNSSVMVTAIIDAATATQMTVQVIDTTLAAIGWPVSTLDLDTVPSSLISAYQVVLDAPFELRRLQLDGASPAFVHLGLYDDAGDRPGALLATTEPTQLHGVGDPVRVDVQQGALFLPAGAYWLVVAGNGPLTTSTVPIAALRCRGTWSGGGLPASLHGAFLTCGNAPPIAIAGLGQAL